MFGWAQEATDDPSQIEAWHIQFPNCNWGLACGPSGLAVVDIDPPIGEESLFRFELEHGNLPPTRIHRSARDGWHYIYKGSVVPTASKLGPGIDTRGGNSYILIPPSTFEGKPYAVEQDLPIAEVPSFVVHAAGASHEHVAAIDGVVLDTGNAKVRAAALLASYIEEGKVAIEGQGGDALTFAVAAEVINLGLSPEGALEALGPWNDACQPPWNIDELREKVENASRYSQNEAGAWSVPPVSERISAEALTNLIAENAAASVAPEQEERSRFAIMGEEEFSKLPKPRWLLENKLVRESIGMIYGESGHYKTFLTIDMAAQVAQKNELAIYVASEGITRTATQDFPAWKMANGEEKIIPFKLVEDMPLMSNEFDVIAFMRRIDEVARREDRQVGLVVLDTLNNAMLGLEENSAMDAGKLIDAMKTIKKAFKTTVLTVHHTRKGTNDARGSTALWAAFDTVINVVSNTDTKLAQMIVKKQRVAELPKHPFSFQGKRVGPGLAFLPITDKDAAVLRDETDIFAPAKISAALVALKAWKPVTVSTQVLVMHLIPQLENESPEDRANSVARGMVGMKGAIKRGHLDGYFEGEGRGIKWSLPAPE
jgi:KaiC/GvpD/RAD55 family RecA-like ATPase